MKRNKVIRKAISMYEPEWSVVAHVESTYRLNTSAAMRLIINEYKRLVNQLPLPLAAANPQERES